MTVAVRATRGAAVLLLGCAAWLLEAGPAAAQTGLRDAVKVSAATRLDWQFAVRGFGPGAAKLPDDYDSREQRYQLWVPKDYDAKKAWPLIAFISPGDGPLGWRAWQKVCEEQGVLFCSPHGAGNNCPAGKRTRIVLDMLDDVRRHYRIDPEQTYLGGFSGGGRMACTIAFALPEFFGGVVPVCGTNPLPSVTYLRHRAVDRLSVAFVTGEKDFNRKENEVYMQPQLHDLGVRTRLWVVPKLGHAVPSAPVLAEVYAWLKDDLKRRREDAKAQPGLAVAPDEAPTGVQQAGRLLETAEAELKKAERTWRGVALLQGVVARWPTTETGRKAQKLLKEITNDEARLKLIEEQGGADERRTLTAQARSLERFGQVKAALQAYRTLAEYHAATPEGKEAAAAIKRLSKKE
jgi:hypothetical protein